MTITIGGLGKQISVYCFVCSEQMSHWCVASSGSIRYEWKCEPCELSLKSDRFGNAKLISK
jgi:hypothetical protein